MRHLDHTPLARGLAIGGAVVGSNGPLVRENGYDVVVFAAEEYQPGADLAPAFRGVETLYCPLDDSGPPITAAELLRARKMVVRDFDEN